MTDRVMAGRFLLWPPRPAEIKAEAFNDNFRETEDSLTSNETRLTALEAASPNGGFPIETVSDYGAVGDGVTDDTVAFQAAFDSLIQARNAYGWSASGGTIYIPYGRYKISSTITISTENTCILGNSGPDNLARNTWIEYSGTGVCFRLLGSSPQTPSGFSASGFSVVGKDKSGSTAFQLRTGDNFARDFLFSRVGIFHFGFGIGVVKDAGDAQTQIGKLAIEHCSAKWNAQVLDFGTSTSCNRLRIVDNDATLNTLGVGSAPIFDIRAFSATIQDNILEGQEDALYVRNSEEVNIQNNFFESNTGYAIRAYETDRLWIGMNRFFGVSTDMYEIENCDDVYLQEPAGRVNDIGGNTNIHDLSTV